MLEPSAEGQDEMVAEIDLRDDGSPCRTGDELEDALTEELGRVTGQVPVVDGAVLGRLPG